MIIRLTMQDPDGTKFVVYCESEDEVAQVEKGTGAKCIAQRESNEVQMKLEQFLCVSGGSSSQKLAEHDPLGFNLGDLS